MVHKTSRKSVTSTVDFFFLSVFLRDVMGGKITRFSTAIQFYELQPMTPAKNLNNFHKVFEV